MADIERWITVNGVHIPIMKGEGAMEAVGRFIKGKRNIAWSKKYKELQDADTDNDARARHGRAHIEATDRYIKSKGPTIKGYSSKIKDADKAYKEKWNELTPNVEKARENYEKSKLRDLDLDKQTYGDYIRGEYAKTKKTKEDLEDYHNRMAQYELSKRNLTSSLRRQYENAEEGRELAALNAHRDVLARIPKAYKLKGDNTKFVNKSTIAAMKEDIRNKSDYALGELIHGIEKTADDRGYRTSGNRKRGLTEYEKKYQDLARAEMRLRRRKNK